MRIRSQVLAAMAIAAGSAALIRRLEPVDELGGQVALITGGSRGLGYLLAERLLRHGCPVAICARDRATLERARQRLSALGDIAAYSCDVGDTDSVARLVEQVTQRFGRIDILINNAANIQVGPLDSLGLEDFRKAIEVTFLGTVRATLEVLPQMRARRSGRIVNITSIGAKVAIPHLLPYDAAKFAAAGFSEGLRAELAGTGIHVTNVVPGLMRTGSPVHVEFRGQPAKEYAWFTAGAIFPGSAISAEKAADQIVDAVRRRRVEVVLSWQAKVLRLVHGIAPGAVTRVAGVVNRLLPDPGNDQMARGTQVRGTLPAPAEAYLDRAAARTNQQEAPRRSNQLGAPPPSS